MTKARYIIIYNWCLKWYIEIILILISKGGFLLRYLAHKSDDSREQLLLDHLLGTAKLSSKFASGFGLENLGYYIGLYHDIGKYSSGFQNRILNDGAKVDHSTAGAKELLNKLPLGSFCIAGHHGGLMNKGSRLSLENGTLFSRLGKELTGKLDYSVFQKEPELVINGSDMREQAQRFCGNDAFSTMFLTRMLFSCLVDADFLDTEKFMSNESVSRGAFDSLDVLYQRYLDYVSEFKPPKNELNTKRCEILDECLEAADGREGLYTLTVPTGGGKTIASLGFALKHAVVHKKARLIYVIPYTSIIEQTADVFKSIVGTENVLEHHMNVDYDKNEELTEPQIERYKLATENWEAPITVTTNVQFFESLFTNKVSRSRKLHNIVNSVIVFDEAQMLPNDFLKPCVKSIEELVVKYGVTAVLCTATQPSLSPLFSPNISLKEICKDVDALYAFFRRVSYKQEKFNNIDELVRSLNSTKRVLCIVNSKKAAQDIFEKLDKNARYHLSTFMCPNHRRRVLGEIKRLMGDKNYDGPCRVIATSLVEAGVDLDFPEVYRELAGLDNIIQAAGRCNREGKKAYQDSMVHIFRLLDEKKVPPSFIRLPIEVTNSVKLKYEDIASIEAIKDYFDELHILKGEGLDSKNIVLRSDKDFPFKDIAHDFVLIGNSGKSILIPYDEESQVLLSLLKDNIRNRSILRSVGQYVVTIYDNQFQKLAGQGALDVIDENIWVLVDLERYDRERGLIIDMDNGVGMFV